MAIKKNKYRKKKKSIQDSSIVQLPVGKHVPVPRVKYDKDIHPYLVLVHMSEGKSLEETAYDMCISYYTLYKWAHKDEDKPDFIQAIKAGEKLSEGWWNKMGRMNINNKEFNSVLFMMNMSNRFGWSRKVTEDKTIKQEIKQLIVHKQVNEIDATATILRILEGTSMLKSSITKINKTKTN